MRRTAAGFALILLSAAPSWADDSKEAGQGTWNPQPAVPVDLPPAERPVRTGGAFGLGPSIGTRSGLSLKLWPTPMHGLVIDVGGTPFVNSLSFALGYRLHPKPLRMGGGWVLHGSFGPGVRLRVAVGPDAEGATTAVPLLGLHVPIGLSLTRDDLPIELFAEAGPGIDFWSAFGLDADAVIGVRFYPTPRPKPAPATPAPPAPSPEPPTGAPPQGGR